MTFPAGTRLGPYEIVSPIGAGGMGEVFRAHDPRLDREVALKILSTEHAANDERRLRFEQEAKSASALSHPNIVSIYEIGQFGESDSRAHYIAMELVHGKSLRDLVSEGPLALRRLLPIAAQIADGLAAAHARGIAHRDLKPENIMVSSDGFAKILDFGLAKLLATTETEGEDRTVARPVAKTTPGTVMGTAAYMSPEQASARTADFRSDQFSFGAILYEMITGRRAFQRETAAQTMAVIIEGDPTPLQELSPRTPPPLRWITERCLSKDPEERYASTRDLARDLHTLRDRLAEASTSSALAAGIGASPARRLGPRGLAVACLAVAGIVGAIGFGLGRRLERNAPVIPPELTRLTFRGDVTSAAFTPDGASVLYTARIGRNPEQLYLVRVGTPEPQLLGKAPGRITGISRNGEVAVLDRGVLSRMPLGGGAPRGIAENVTNASWAPDGNNLAITRQTPAGQQLEFPIGTVLTRGVFVGNARVSTRQGEIAFFQFDAGRWWLAVMTLPDRKVRRIAGAWERVGGISWDQGGKSLFVSVLEKTHPVVNRVTLDGEVTPVARVGRMTQLLDVAADGRLLVSQLRDSVRMIKRDLTSNVEQELTWLDSSYVETVSADGGTILFSERGDGGTEKGAVYLYRPGSDVPVRLGEGLAMDLSKDGKWALSSTQTSPERMLLLPTGVGEPRTLSTGKVINFELCSFFPDSRRILVVGNEAGKSTRLHVYDLVTAKLRPFGDEGLQPETPNAISPDGKWVVASAAGVDYLVSVDSGRSRKIDAGGFVIGWSTDHRLFVADDEGDKVGIELVHPESGARQPVTNFPIGESEGGAFLDGLAITADGKQVVYTIGRPTSELYALELAQR